MTHSLDQYPSSQPDEIPMYAIVGGESIVLEDHLKSGVLGALGKALKSRGENMVDLLAVQSSPIEIVREEPRDEALQ